MTVAPPVTAGPVGSTDAGSVGSTDAGPVGSTDAGPVGSTDAGPDLPDHARCARMTRGSERCCAPSPDVRVCVEELSAHHVLGTYDSRVLVVTSTSGNVTTTFRRSVEMRRHGSMKVPDLVLARLEVVVTAEGITLTASYGCRDAAARRSAVCEAEGRYGRRGGAFVRLDPEE